MARTGLWESPVQGARTALRLLGVAKEVFRAASGPTSGWRPDG